MIKYRTIWGEIKPREITRETEKKVFFLGKKYGGEEEEQCEAKESQYQNYFDTWQQAHDFVVRQQEAKVKSLRAQLERENRRLGQIRGMKEPLDTGAKG
jgi:hypothetical protein